MIWRQTLVLLSGVVLSAYVIRRVQREAREAGGVATSSQVAIGVMCGGIGAMLAMIPNGDAVPDHLEVPLVVTIGVGAAALALRSVRHRMRGRRPSAGPDPADAVRV